MGQCQEKDWASHQTVVLLRGTPTRRSADGALTLSRSDAKSIGATKKEKTTMHLRGNSEGVHRTTGLTRSPVYNRASRDKTLRDKLSAVLKCRSDRLCAVVFRNRWLSPPRLSGSRSPRQLEVPLSNRSGTRPHRTSEVPRPSGPASAPPACVFNCVSN